MNYFITTNSGLTVNLLNPKPDSINIRDIGHALANICRFSGQCKLFYSVAQHSLLVASLVEEDLMMAGLLHDAAEAYIGDIPRGLKRLLGKNSVAQGEHSLEDIEKGIMRVIESRFGVKILGIEEVKQADEEALYIESHELLPNVNGWTYERPINPNRLRTIGIPYMMSPLEVGDKFHMMFQQLRALTKA